MLSVSVNISDLKEMHMYNLILTLNSGENKKN